MMVPFTYPLRGLDLPPERDAKFMLKVVAPVIIRIVDSA